MELTPYLDGLRDDLTAAAALGDEHTRQAAALLASAIQPSARLAMMTALADFAAEVTDSLTGITVDLRLDGKDLRVSVTHEQQYAAGGGDSRDKTFAADSGSADNAGGADDLGRAVRDAGDELSRTTLRIVQRLKAQAENVASAQGMSLNTYIQHAVADAVRSAGRPGPRRF